MKESKFIENAALQPILQLGYDKVKNYVWPGLNSYMLGDSPYGKVRMFENTRKHYNSITPHSHRFDFTCLVLRGKVKNINWFVMAPASAGETYQISELTYNGKIGSHEVKKCAVESYGYKEVVYLEGEFYHMKYDEIHSIEFSDNALVLFFEGTQFTTKSVILEPYVDGQTIPTYKVEPWMFEKEHDE